MGLPVDYWEVTNEPALPHNTEEDKGGYFKHSYQDFLAYWDTTYDAIRAAYPEAKIAGPSFGGSDAPDIEPFLAHCKEKGQRLDVLAWHFPSYVREKETDYKMPKGVQLDPDRAHRSIEEVRNLVESRYPKLGVKEYHIDEWGAHLALTGPGLQMALFYYMDLAGVDRAAKASWEILGGILVGPKTPRTSYWCWVEYAQQDGGLRLVTETNDRGVIALASRHDEERIVRAIVARSKRRTGGADLPAVATKVDFEGLGVEGPAEVTILSLGPSNGPLWEEDLEGLTTVKTETVQNGKLTLKLDEVKENQVYSITIAPVGTRAKQEAAEKGKQRQKELAEKQKQLPKKSVKQLHFEGLALAAKAADKGIIRINSGSEFGYTDPQGNSWFADKTYKEGGFGNVGGGLAHRGPIEITGTDNHEIYRSELWGQSAYRVTLANGNYLVRLHWAETYGANRKFDVTIEGKTVLKDLNPLKEAGGRSKAFFREFTIEVADGVLDIEFPCEKGGPPMINGIEAIRQ